MQHEKGVDVQIAVDVLVAAYENQCDRIYLVSSVTDLILAIKKAQEEGKSVIYVGFSHQVSKALLASCRETQTLTIRYASTFYRAAESCLIPFPTSEINTEC